MKIKDNKNNTVIVYEDNLGTQWYCKQGEKKILATQDILFEGVDTNKLNNIDIINSSYSIETIEDLEDLVNE